MTDRQREFLRKRLHGGRLIHSGAAAQFLEGVAALEILAQPLIDGPPERLARILPTPDTGDERER
jgi:hypothetical protein